MVSRTDPSRQMGAASANGSAAEQGDAADSPTLTLQRKVVKLPGLRPAVNLVLIGPHVENPGPGVRHSPLVASIAPPAPRHLWGERIAIHAAARPVRKAEVAEWLLRLCSPDAWSTALIREPAIEILVV